VKSTLSINTWVQLEEDREARCHEAITRLLVTSLMTSGGQEMQVGAMITQTLNE
jgi:uncharacterized circularly permuted ATP-grasp superfamily protein